MKFKSLEIDEWRQFEQVVIDFDSRLVENILDPYITDPALHLFFVGALVCDNGTALGISTREILKLNRGELAEVRKAQLEKILNIYSTINRADIPLAARKAIYKNLIEVEGSKKAPYTAMAREVLNTIKNKLPPEVTA